MSPKNNGNRQRRPSAKQTQRSRSSARNRTMGSSARNKAAKNSYQTKPGSIANINMGKAVWGSNQQKGRNSSERNRSRTTRTSSSLSGSSKRSGTSGSGAAASVASGAATVAVTAGSGLLAGLGAVGRAIKKLVSSSRIVQIVLVVVLVLFLGWAIDSALTGNKIYSGVKVGTVDVGGMTVKEAQDAIDAKYTPLLMEKSVTIFRDEDAKNAGAVKDVSSGESSAEADLTDTVDSKRNAAFWITDANTLQARVDAASLAQNAYSLGRSEGGIFTRIASSLRGTVQPIEAQYNSDALETLAGGIDDSIGLRMQNSAVVVNSGSATITVGHDGNQVDRYWLREMLDSQFFSEDDAAEHSFVAEVRFAPMQIDEQTASACADAINEAISHPVTFNFKESSWVADPSILGGWISTSLETDSNGSYFLQPSFSPDSAKQDIIRNLQADYNDDSQADKKISFIKSSSNTVMVRVSAGGTMPIVLSAINELNTRVFDNHESVDSLEIQGQDIPEVLSVEAAVDYGIISIFSEYTTEYTSGAVARNTNIHLAADLLNDSIVGADGGIWSFNEIAGDCNAEKGFQGAGSIVEGEYVDEIGGGICQVATTVFNAVYEGGLPVVSRRNHSLYVASYPAGRDAAISWPYLDFKWKNDLSSDILLRMSYTDTSVTAKLYGIDPAYTVESSVGDWVEGEPYSVVTKYDDTLAAGTSYVKSYGTDGQSITVSRTVKDKDGDIVRTDAFESVYDPKDEIVVKGGTGTSTTSSSTA